jgi:tetratricopeptide (TPR) repeat protein
MQAERDHLRTHVFPQLEELLRKRRHNLGWVDLRLGVATASLTEGDARELQVLKVCLAEVKRCRPFLIVLLGDRYGWVPPADRITAAAREEGFGADVAGRSVTDLEIDFGVLSDPQEQTRSFFYFRDPLPYAEMPPEVAALYADAHAPDPQAAARVGRLAALKRRVEATLPRRVRRYSVGWDRVRRRVTGLDAWGRRVVEDIWAELDAETAAWIAAPEQSWQQAERNALDDYVEDSARDFTGRQAALAHILQHAASTTRAGINWGICVTGESGSGKSAIFGELRRRLRATNAFVLAHAAGASLRSVSVEAMLRRWIEELTGELGVDAGLAENADPDTIDATFRALLARMAAARRVVVLVDALDQFEATTQARHVTWLPHAVPANMRFIATAVAGDASKALRERSGIEMLALAPLNAKEARCIAEAISKRHHREFEPDVLDALLAKSDAAGLAWGNPLWVTLAVEELNLIDADDFARATRTYTGSPGQRIRALVLDTVNELPNDIPGLYQATFERAEELFGLSLARAFVGFIAVSRSGWRETDFRSLLPRLSGEPWDDLRFAYLRRLFRGQMRQHGEAAQWDFAHVQMRLAARQYLADLSVTETEFHALAADHLLSLTSDDPMRQNEAMFHLLSSKDWKRAARYYGSSALNAAELEGAHRALANAMVDDRIGPDYASRLLDSLFEPEELQNRKVAASVADRLFNVAVIIGSARRGTCIALVKVIRDAFARLTDISDIDGANDQGRSLAQPEYYAELRTNAGSPTLAVRLAQLTGDQTNWIGLSKACQEYACMLSLEGANKEAIKSGRDGLAIIQRLARRDPEDTFLQQWLSEAHMTMGRVLLSEGHRGCLLEALKYFRDALAIQEMQVKRDMARAEILRDFSRPFARVADILTDPDNLPDGLASFRTAINAEMRLAIAKPENVWWDDDTTLSGVAIGNLPTRFRRRLFQLSASYSQIGWVMTHLGMFPEALRFYRDSLAAAERLVRLGGGDPFLDPSLAMPHFNVGRGHWMTRNLPGAINSFQRSLSLAKRKVDADPTNMRYRHALSLFHYYIAQVLSEQGKRSEAQRAYHESIAIAEFIVKRDPTNVAVKKLQEEIVTWWANQARS